MRQTPLFNEHWYRVKTLKPRLVSDVITRRHVYRGTPSYVLYRESSKAVHRASAETFELLGSLDGEMTLEQLWQLALQKQGDQAPSQSELMQLMAQLHEAELLLVDRRLSADHLFSRAQEKNRQDIKQRYLNPLFIRFSLLNPDRLLDLTYPKISWLFSRYAGMLWMLIVFIALVELLPRWSVLTYELSTLDLITPMHTLLFALVYPAMKLIHEMAHGLMVKRFGGNVRETGIAMMVLLPIPYVDASYAAVLPDKRQRILISAAGIMVELGIAALAALVWVNSNGTTQDVALTVMLIGGVSTVLFNANPLLKFDGYYVLSDWLEIPNLADRSRAFIRESIGNKLFGDIGREVVPVDQREKFWLIAYGVMSGVYRFGLMVFIAWIISGQYFFFGALVALWIFFNSIVLPLIQFGRFVNSGNSTLRLRATGIVAFSICVLLLPAIFLPLPHSSFAQGVVWLPDNAVVRVASDCEVTEVMTQPGDLVQSGEILFECGNPELEHRVNALQAQLDEVRARQHGLGAGEQVERMQLSNTAAAISAQLASEREKMDKQLLTAQSSGEFVLLDNTQLLGSFFSQGDVAAYIVTPDSRTVRMALNEAAIADIEGSVERVELAFATLSHSFKTYPSSIVRQTPKGEFTVSSAGLTSVGGGSLLADPAGDGLAVMEPVFGVDLEWPVAAPLVNIGSHVHVKLTYSPKPLADRVVSGVKRAFLGREGA